ncbi:hypothetical protein [Phormidium sp. FACHB-1136]|uniref:hypothetical protein n=1 Tax=Phormidium sp. FACHB-1136 TaxID=2692848 RepID=UPI0016848D66|nr:hypothetical protein [Phormidium sp. FACHB-1136]MBD2426345.1 hypothetical protein [Phormidium sp. FACHB-1136]
MTIFFTIEVKSKYIGISDTLSRLYKAYCLGISLSYSYVHQPFFCRRSLPISMFDRIIRKISGFNDGKSSRFIKENDLFVANFLGMGDSECDSDFDARPKFTVDIARLLDDHYFQDLDHFKTKIEDSIPSINSIIINFLVTDEIYNDQVSGNLERLLGSTRLEDCHASVVGSSFKEFAATRYWKARSRQPISLSFDSNKIRLLIHIRRGDRAWIELKDKILLMHGNEFLVIDQNVNSLQNSDTQSLSIASIPVRFRKPVSIEVIAQVFEQLSLDHGRAMFSIIVISDGYKRAYQELSHAIRSNRIQVSQSDRKQIDVFFRQQQKEIVEFAKHINAELILGEDSKMKFMKSVHAVICADFIVNTTGGFTKLNRVFRNQDPPSLFLSTSDLTPQKLGVFLAEARRFRKPDEI